MAAHGIWCVNGILAVFNSEVTWKASGGSSLKGALFTNSATLDKETVTTYSLLSGEVSSSGTGYTTGGQALTLIDAHYDALDGYVHLDANDLVWNSASMAARYLVVYDSVSDKILGWIDFVNDITSTNGTFTVQIPTTGVFKIKLVVPV